MSSDPFQPAPAADSDRPVSAANTLAPQPGGPRRSPKIKSCHLARLAIVYVRQSSPHQVLEHRESRERQYDLVNDAVALGWPRERVLLIDEDQGHSAKSASNRPGFQRVVAEVTMNHVGLVLGLEVSRLARCSVDWHNLSELCALFDALLGDQDGVYDANDPNDRLILGLKGMMSEVELITMHNRLERGRLRKAERGELFPGSAPIGYLKLPTGQVALDPDEQVRSGVRLIFTLFEELGTAWAVFHYLVDREVRLGYRVRKGGRRGELEWRLPTPSAIRTVLTHPFYAGAYAYGRRPIDPQQRGSGARCRGRRVSMDQWKVLKQDQLPAYITWEQYLANQERLQQNRSTSATPGVPRAGHGLLSGLVVCGNCGLRLITTHPRRAGAHYACRTHFERGGEPACHGLRAAVVDDLVSRELLRALAPAALELSLQAVDEIQNERARLDQHWRQQLQRAHYEAERAERQYRAVEPENRLVARALEQRWEEALRNEACVKEDYDRFLSKQPPQLSLEERLRVQALAEDIPALWHAADMTNEDRKWIIRCLVERVVVQVQPDSEHVEITIHWQGGFVSSHHSVRPVAYYEQMADYRRLLARISELRCAGENATAIAARLNAECFRTPRQRGAFSAAGVRQLLSRAGLAVKKNVKDILKSHEWQLPDLASALQVDVMKLRAWARRGWLHGHAVKKGVWLAWADEEELQRLKALAARSRRGATCHPKDLTTPKKREES